MKAILKKVYNKLYLQKNYTAFLTIDNNYISGAVYKIDQSLSNSLVCENSAIVKGTKKANIISKTLFAHSIAECLDSLEEVCKYRIKNVIVTLIGFNSRSINYSLSLQQVNSINFKNLLQYINIREVYNELGEDYFLTNLLPWKITNNDLSLDKGEALCNDKSFIIGDKKFSSYVKYSNDVNFLPSSTIGLLGIGFKNDFIYTLLEIFYNLSIKVDYFLSAPLILPLIIPKEEKHKPVIIISKEYTLLYSANLVKFIPFGTNLILEKIAKKTNIPYDILLKYTYNIMQDVLNCDIPLFYRIEGFVINDIKKIVCNSIQEYIQELYNLIIDKFLNKRDTIIIINDKLKLLKEHSLLSFTDSLNIEFYNQNSSIHLSNETFITDWITQGAFKYMIKNYKKDIALLKFNQQESKLVITYRN